MISWFIWLFVLGWVLRVCLLLRLFSLGWFDFVWFGLLISLFAWVVSWLATWVWVMLCNVFLGIGELLGWVIENLFCGLRVTGLMFWVLITC